jgi:hypothetical protein
MVKSKKNLTDMYKDKKHVNLYIDQQAKKENQV